MGAAFAGHREKTEGSLEKGELADLIILDRDLFKTPATESHKTEAQLTMVGGKVVYRAPYSLPWLLRPATPSSVVRLDETMAFYETPASGANGSSYLTSLIATYKVNPRVVPVFRAVFVNNHAPTPGKDPSGSGFANPLLGVNYLRALKNGWRWTGFLASTIPVGAGGGALPIRAPPPP